MKLIRALLPLGVAMLLSMAGCGGDDDSNNDDGFSTECTADLPYFSVLPIPMDTIKNVIVLGQINPPGDVVPRGQTGLS